MKIPSRGTLEFWRLYRTLPALMTAMARKNYRLWPENALHPSLRFKSIGKPNWSAHVRDDSRVVGKFIGNEFVWEWIGIHQEYTMRF